MDHRWLFDARRRRLKLARSKVHIDAARARVLAFAKDQALLDWLDAPEGGDADAVVEDVRTDERSNVRSREAAAPLVRVTGGALDVAAQIDSFVAKFGPRTQEAYKNDLRHFGFRLDGEDAYRGLKIFFSLEAGRASQILCDWLRGMLDVESASTMRRRKTTLSAFADHLQQQGLCRWGLRGVSIKQDSRGAVEEGHVGKLHHNVYRVLEVKQALERFQEGEIELTFDGEGLYLRKVTEEMIARWIRAEEETLPLFVEIEKEERARLAPFREMRRVVPWGDPFNVDDQALKKLIESGGARLTPVELPPIKEAVQMQTDGAPFEGGKEHQALSALAAQWLERRGVGWTMKGRTYSAGLCDVRAKNEKLFVECGNLHGAPKPLRAMKAGDALLYIPFPSLGHEDKTIGYLLEPKTVPKKG